MTKYTCNGRPITIGEAYEGHGRDDPSGWYYSFDDEPGSHWISAAASAVRFEALPTLSHTNYRLHVLLTDQGACIHEHHEADFDDGDAENGPGSDGHPAWDEYTSESHFIVVDHTGLIVHSEPIDWALVTWIIGQENMS
jgi:hypothetical protein